MEERNETDWERELRSLGRIVGVTNPDASAEVIGDALTSERDTLRDALRELLSGHDNLYVAHFGPHSNPLDDIAAKAARSALLLANTGGTENG